ncbi:MAG: hypothetical protein RIT81_08945 [Deltaproteobacteria bacterium]
MILLGLTTACAADGEVDLPTPMRDGGARDGGARDAGAKDGDAGIADGGHTDAGASGPCRGATPLERSGTVGAPVAGGLVAFVRDGEGEPYVGATVVLEAGGMRWEQVVGPLGCAVFEDDAIVAPLAVHAFQPLGTEFPTARSFVGYDRDVVTFFIPDDPEPPGTTSTSTAQITGTVTNLEVLGSSTAETARLVRVSSYASDANSVRADLREGTPFSTAAVVEGGGFDFPEYQLTAHFDERATVNLIAYGSLYDAVDGRRQPMTHLGFLPGVVVTPDRTLTGRDISLDHALTERIVVTPNGGPPLEEAAIYVELLPAEGGAIGLGGTFGDAVPASFEVNAPPREGALAEAMFRATVYALSFDSDRRWFVSRVGAGPTLDLPAPPAFPTNYRTNGRTLEVDLDPRTGDSAVVRAHIGPAPHDADLWRVFVHAPGSALSVTFPEVPAGAASPPAAFWFSVSAEGEGGGAMDRVSSGGPGSL